MQPILITLLITTPIIAVGAWLYLRRTTFRPQRGPRQADRPSKPLPRYVPILVYFVMLIAAMVSSLEEPITHIRWEDLRFLPIVACLFPMGLGLIFETPRYVHIPLMFLSYGGFIGFLVAFVRARFWQRLAWLCFGFACLLLLNATGCHKLNKRMSTWTMLPKQSLPSAVMASSN